MIETPLYSIRMRAAQGGPHEEGGLHISGAERIGLFQDLQTIAAELLGKSLSHTRGEADYVQIVVEKLDTHTLQKVLPLSVSTHHVSDWQQGREKAAELLSVSGISRQAIYSGLEILKSAGNLRGAAILDGRTGKRLDDRGERGIRASRMDWDSASFTRWAQDHGSLGSIRIREALALATKVVYSPFTMAELCWSDDPDYVTGYVASLEHGYQRINHLKEWGDPAGGRVFFVHPETDLDDYIQYLEKTPIWIGGGLYESSR